MCKLPCEPLGRATTWDHFSPLWISHDNSNANFFPIHRDPCDIEKTARDAADRAKVKRLIAKEDGMRRPRKQIRSPGFSKTLTRGFDGKVRTR